MNVIIDSKVLGMVGTNCYLLVNEDTKEAVLIDPADSPERIDEMIKKNNCSLRGILLTHGHFDHIGAVDVVRQKYGVKVYASCDEEHLLMSMDENLSLHYGLNLTVKADVFHNDGDIINIAGMDIKAIHTPGHTAGGTCYLIAFCDKCNGMEFDGGLLFSGDTLFCGSVGRTDFPTGSMSKLVRNIKDKLLILPDNTRVYPGHGEGTTIGYEKKNNPYLA
ncbi:MAG: MBL fold metallo-hydrolase [Lachnospira sp.]